jgi:hypothetical protein
VPADVQTVGSGQHEIEDDQVVAPARHGLDRPRAVALVLDRETRLAQVHEHELGDGIVVFDQKQGEAHAMGRS